jgi:hypothetical protein
VGAMTMNGLALYLIAAALYLVADHRIVRFGARCSSSSA